MVVFTHESRCLVSLRRKEKRAVSMQYVFHRCYEGYPCWWMLYQSADLNLPFGHQIIKWRGDNLHVFHIKFFSSVYVLFCRLHLAVFHMCHLCLPSFNCWIISLHNNNPFVPFYVNNALTCCAIQDIQLEYPSIRLKKKEHVTCAWSASNVKLVNYFAWYSTQWMLVNGLVAIFI